MRNDQLSPHFRLSEFAGHDGTPVPARSVPRLRALCRHWLEPLRQRYGVVTVVSGFRTLAHNHEVGGAQRSQHVYGSFGPGVAADVVCATGSPADWYAFLDRLGAPGVGKYSTHVHVDNRNGRARW